MKEEKLYRCEYCYTQYADKHACVKCEESHKKIKSAKALKYVSYKHDTSGMPRKILITFEDGEECEYKRF